MQAQAASGTAGYKAVLKREKAHSPALGCASARVTAQQTIPRTGIRAYHDEPSPIHELAQSGPFAGLSMQEAVAAFEAGSDEAPSSTLTSAR